VLAGLTELADGVSVDEIRARTEATFSVGLQKASQAA